MCQNKDFEKVHQKKFLKYAKIKILKNCAKNRISKKCVKKSFKKCAKINILEKVRQKVKVWRHSRKNLIFAKKLLKF